MKLLRVLALFIVLFFIIWIVKDPLFGFVLETIVNRTTALVMNIEEVKVNPFAGSLELKKIKLLNPRNAQDTFVADIEFFSLDCVMSGIFKKTIHLSDLKVKINELWVVKDKTSQSLAKTFDMFSSIMKKEGKDSDGKPALQPQMPLKIQIDSFDFLLKKVVYKDYSKGDPPRTFTVEADYSQHLENIKSIQKLLEPLGILTVTSVFKGIPETIKDDAVSQTQEDAPGTLEDPVAEGIKKTGKTITDQTKNAVESEVESLIDKKIRDGVRSVLPLNE